MILLRFYTALFSIVLIMPSTFGIDSLKQTVLVDTLQSQQFLSTVEHSLFEYYKETWGKERAYAIIDELGYEDNLVVTFPDSVYTQRLNDLVSKTPFRSKANPVLIRTLKYFIKRRGKYTSIIIGRSKLYFPMFEDYLSKHNLPLELKYLPIIESALRPTGKSWAGAAGLWQIMYRTGRSLDLYSDSYVDDRLHPEKSTDAACKYLKYLYGLYGDWDLALAGYNSGPGNVNKAIRRAGGKTNYWAIRPFLPKETQMYVPNFYAMMYMMNYYPEHNITPKEAKFYLHETDTICLKQSIRISHLDSILAIDSESFKLLNPQYKTDIIPKTEIPQCITLPIDKLKMFFQFEDSLYHYEAYLQSIGKNYVILEKKKTHYVKPDETLASIGYKYDVSTTKLREWNGLRKSSVYPGQKLIVLIPEKRHLDNYTSPASSSSTKPTTHSTTPSTKKITYSGSYKYYTLASGENLWLVSKKLGIPFAKLQKLNQDLNPKKMRPGQKIRIGTK